MKKLLRLLTLTVIPWGFAWSQCAPTCSNYAVIATTYSVFPTSGTTVNPTSFYPTADDGTLTPVPIGFTFNYYCNNYTDVVICTNGFLQLNYGTPPDFSSPFVHPTQTFPDPMVPNGLVALNMIDMDVTSTGVITYGTFGVAPNRMFVLTYTNVPIFGTANLNSGQIVLYETSNNIAIHTGTLFPSNNTLDPKGTQGIENITGSDGKASPGRNNNANWYSTANNTAYLFLPVTPLPPTAITGSTLLCEGAFDSYNATFMAGATSYSWTLPSGWSGTSTVSILNTNAGASGNLSVTATYTCGTSDPTTLAVTTVPAPTVAIVSVTPNAFCSGKTVTVNIAGNATSYTLNPSGANGPSSPLTDIPLVSTVYTLVGTNNAGCNSVNTATILVSVKETPTIAVSSGTICLGQTFNINATGTYTYQYSNGFAAVTPTAPGQYAYTTIGTATNGCASAPVVSNLTVSALPGTNVFANRPVICKNESTTLTAQGAATYSWANSASTSSTLVVSLTNPAYYTVTGTSAEGCVKTATVFISVNPCVGIDEMTTGESLSLFPNPTTGELTIRSPHEVNIEVYDFTGRLVHRQDLTQGINTVNLVDQPQGQYFIRANGARLEQSVIIIRN